MQTYQTKSGGGYFFAGLLFVLILGGGGYWMLHKEKLSEVVTAIPRKPDIAVLDARAKPHFDRAKQNIPAVVEELTSYGSMVKFCYLASCDKLSGTNRAQEYLASVINARIIDPCREGAKVYGCDVNPASFQKHIAELNSDAAVRRYKHNPGGISRDTKKLIEAAGFQAVDEGETRRLRNVSRLGFHAFRHSYVSMLINSGVNPLVVRDLVGHTSVDMTARYTHVALDTKVNAVKNLPILGEMPSQGTPFETVISSLPASQIPRLAACLESLLTPKQKEELLRQL